MSLLGPGFAEHKHPRDAHGRWKKVTGGAKLPSITSGSDHEAKAAEGVKLASKWAKKLKAAHAAGTEPEHVLSQAFAYKKLQGHAGKAIAHAKAAGTATAEANAAAAMGHFEKAKTVVSNAEELAKMKTPTALPAKPTGLKMPDGTTIKEGDIVSHNGTKYVAEEIHHAGHDGETESHVVLSNGATLTHDQLKNEAYVTHGPPDASAVSPGSLYAPGSPGKKWNGQPDTSSGKLPNGTELKAGDKVYFEEKFSGEYKVHGFGANGGVSLSNTMTGDPLHVSASELMEHGASKVVALAPNTTPGQSAPAHQAAALGHQTPTSAPAAKSSPAMSAHVVDENPHHKLQKTDKSAQEHADKAAWIAGKVAKHAQLAEKLHALGDNVGASAKQTLALQAHQRVSKHLAQARYAAKTNDATDQAHVKAAEAAYAQSAKRVNKLSGQLGTTAAPSYKIVAPQSPAPVAKGFAAVQHLDTEAHIPSPGGYKISVTPAMEVPKPKTPSTPLVPPTGPQTQTGHVVLANGEHIKVGDKFVHEGVTHSVATVKAPAPSLGHPTTGILTNTPVSPGSTVWKSFKSEELVAGGAVKTSVPVSYSSGVKISGGIFAPSGHGGALTQAGHLSESQFSSLKSAYVKKLPSAEKEATLKYSGGSYTSINGEMRASHVVHPIAGVSDFSKLQQHTTTIVKAQAGIMKHILAEPTKLIRGAGGQDSIDHFTKYGTVGTEFVEPAFSSSSHVWEKAFKTPLMLVITVPKGFAAAPIPSHHGHEGELLLPANTRYRIDKIEHNPKGVDSNGNAHTTGSSSTGRMVMHVTVIAQHQQHEIPHLTQAIESGATAADAPKPVFAKAKHTPADEVASQAATKAASEWSAKAHAAEKIAKATRDVGHHEVAVAVHAQASEAHKKASAAAKLVEDHDHADHHDQAADEHEMDSKLMQKWIDKNGATTKSSGSNADEKATVATNHAISASKSASLAHSVLEHQDESVSSHAQHVVVANLHGQAQDAHEVAALAHGKVGNDGQKEFHEGAAHEHKVEAAKIDKWVQDQAANQKNLAMHEEAKALSHAALEAHKSVNLGDDSPGGTAKIEAVIAMHVKAEQAHYKLSKHFKALGKHELSEYHKTAANDRIHDQNELEKAI